MCGIIAVLRQRSGRTPPEPAQIEASLEALTALLTGARTAETVSAAAEHGEHVDALLKGPEGVHCLISHPELRGRLERDVAAAESWVEEIESGLDAGEIELDAVELERTNAAIVRLKDALWAVTRDRLTTAARVAELAGPAPTRAAIDTFCSVQIALSAIDRLEVRGRDSAGLHLLVSGHGLDLNAPDVQALIAGRDADPLYVSRAVRTPNGLLSFVYKAAAEIGELGDNVRALRAEITDDALLRRALEADTADTIVLGHTRWASVGMVSQPNAHPLNHEELGRADGPYVAAALNGDVDNYADLAARHGLELPPEITTDAKVIPALTSRGVAGGQDFEEAFRQTVSSFIGSVAIAASAADRPDELALALRGSGQALYVGLCDDQDAFVVASEPYGVVEVTSRYLRMDGETPGNPDQPAASQGQIVVLQRQGAGTLAGVRRLAYDGTPLPIDEGEIQRAEITTRDIDRGSFPHFLLKEISEAPHSLRKTLRGKITERDGSLHATLSDDTLPPHIRAALRDGTVKRILVVGQGTAAVAGRGVSAVMAEALGNSAIAVQALPATELSGFHLRDDMSDTLIVAISQSGTTTDTNRTVDLVRGRGAAVVSIVNRRNSDLTDRSDGVLYTSDGRDVEMSVASTKAFYAQIAAGTLLSFAIASEADVEDSKSRHEILTALRALPAAMERVLELRGEIAASAAAHAPSRRYWAVVGNGNNRIAAEEIRIKLSELCYKSIACDTTEDKKHIDLSAEPLILVCAAGLVGSNADDVAKEVEIYRAHKAAPLVVATEDEDHFSAALAVISVPTVHPSLDFVLATVAGHLFGYEAARAIDSLAGPLRHINEAVERLATLTLDGDDLLQQLSADIQGYAAEFFANLRDNKYDGQMEASTATRLASLLRYAMGMTPLESFAIEHDGVGTPAVVVEHLAEALTRGVDELTRPVDAIKHQAKTVTVGISRADEDLLAVPLVAALLATDAPRDHIGYRDLRTLAAVDGAVEEIVGHTRYSIDGDPGADGARIAVVGQGGVAAAMPSRTSEDPTLRGTKRQVADEKHVLVALGASDQRHVIITPEVRSGKTVGLTLLHVRFKQDADLTDLRDALRGYRHRYETLRDAVMETEPEFKDDLLRTVPVSELLTSPIQALADRWRTA